jgi:hypothetical protein
MLLLVLLRLVLLLLLVLAMALLWLSPKPASSFSSLAVVPQDDNTLLPFSPDNSTPSSSPFWAWACSSLCRFATIARLTRWLNLFGECHNSTHQKITAQLTARKKIHACMSNLQQTHAT